MVYAEFINATLELFGYVIVGTLCFVTLLMIKKIITTFL